MLSPTLIEKYVRHVAAIMEPSEVIDRLVEAEQECSRLREQVRKLKARYPADYVTREAHERSLREAYREGQHARSRR